jgi:hypothetical protein
MLTEVMNIWMDRIEQRVIVKYFFLKGHGSKLIHKEFVSTVQENAISLFTIQKMAQGIHIRRSFLRRRRTACKASEFFGPGSSALSEEVSVRKFSSHGRAFLGGSGCHQEHS